MENKLTFFKYNKNILILTVMICVALFLLNGFLLKFKINHFIVIYFVSVYYIIATFFTFVAYQNYIKNKNTNNKIMNYKIANTLAKLIIISISMFVVINWVGFENAQNAILVSLFFYLIFTFLETSILININKLK